MKAYTIRRDPVYLSSDTWRACLLLAKSGKFDSGNGTKATADELADNLLRETLENKYPQILEHQKQVESMEQKLVKTL